MPWHATWEIGAACNDQSVVVYSNKRSGNATLGGKIRQLLPRENRIVIAIRLVARLICQPAALGVTRPGDCEEETSKNSQSRHFRLAKPVQRCW